MSVDVGLHDGQRTCFGTNGLPIRIIYLWRVPNKNSIYPRASGDTQICMAESYHFTFKAAGIIKFVWLNHTISPSKLLGKKPRQTFSPWCHRSGKNGKSHQITHFRCALSSSTAFLRLLSCTWGRQKKGRNLRFPFVGFYHSWRCPHEKEGAGFLHPKKWMIFLFVGFYGWKRLATYP